MIREKARYFFESLDSYLRQGFSANEALEKTVDAYANVFFNEETELARAATIALKDLKELEKKDERR